MEALDTMFQSANRFKPEVNIPIAAGLFCDLLRIMALQEQRLSKLESPASDVAAPAVP